MSIVNAHYHFGSRLTRQSGFSLIEVLITIVVSAIGLIGLASMQATGLRNNLSSYHRSQATVLAYDIADRMRANCNEKNDECKNSEINTIQKYLTSFMAPSDAEAQSECKNSGGCSLAELAEDDLYDWNEALQEALPGPVGTITSTGTPAIYTVSISWDENRDGDIDDDDPVFSVSFRP